MADQMINQLPVKTAPQTGDKFLVVGAAEEQLIDYDKLADAILNKLTSKAYSLEQGTKSLVAALNELNSKTYGMYCKKLFLGSTGKGISLKFQKTSWNKHTALVIGCDNTTGVIHEVIAVHYDSDEEQVVARTSGTKKWGIDQNAGTVSANFIVNSLILVIHTGFEEIKIIN